MTKNRLEAFSDGVLAIIITIMVLELHAPHSADLSSLAPLVPVFFSYALSFIYVGIYWNNHHHMLQAAERVNGAILWANLHLLFWLSLIPFTTAWVGLNGSASAPAALYGAVLLFAGVAYTILARLLASHHGADSAMSIALGRDRKGRLSVAIYAAAIPLAFVSAALAYALYALVAVMWVYPDPRFERTLTKA